MSAVYIDLNIDCAEDNCKSEKVTGYEHGIKIFRFKPLNKNIPIDLSGCTGAAYVGTKSDGKIIGNACEIKDNKILLPLTSQMTTARGDLKGHIEVYYPTGTLKFAVTGEIIINLVEIQFNSVGLIGTINGSGDWSDESYELKCSDGVWSTVITFTGGTNEFKARVNDGWDISFGGSSNTTSIIVINEQDLNNMLSEVLV